MSPFGLRELQPLSLRLTVLSLSLALALLAFQAIRHNFPHYDLSTLIVISVLLLAAVLLMKMSRWGRKIVVAFLWLLVVVVPMGVINPFFISDMTPEGGTPPSVGFLLAIVVPFVAWGIWCLRILGKYKEKFS